MAIKILSVEEGLSNTAPESISNASRVRVYNNTGADVVIGRYDYSNTLVGSITIRNSTEIDLIKSPTDFLMVIDGAQPRIVNIGIGY